jgi:hypothetical protein
MIKKNRMMAHWNGGNRLENMENGMNKSESIKELASALSKAQAMIEGAIKDKTNPAFRSKYADLGACWDACRDPLTKHGLSVMQLPMIGEGSVRLETILMHSSGEFISSEMQIPVSKHDAQGYGSALTYARRYALCAFVGIAPEDDDGNGASAKAPTKQANPENERSASKEYPKELPIYTEAQLVKNLPAWQEAINSGRTTADNIVAKVSSGYRLTRALEDRIRSLEKHHDVDPFVADMESAEQLEQESSK